MGTRADFYAEKTNGTLEYLGSIGWDGYPDGIDFRILHADTAKEYKTEVYTATRLVHGCSTWRHLHTSTYGTGALKIKTTALNHHRREFRVK